ncbi:hypothetical protein RN001_008313 [Aquatica leii]|uniref:Uncharacterized protein n=1 Tax=Aquatica leii TaxID=1421715 RepID=A0AAN7P9H4_9COLE|nr:hypothetical protein RN001_008313 [Aquatica leii]
MEEASNNLRNPHPKEKANFLSAATFFYTVPTFIHGHRNEFDESDLYETLTEYKSNILGDKLEGLWDKEVVKAHQRKGCLL